MTAKRVLRRLTLSEENTGKSRANPKPKKIKDRVLQQEIKPIRRREISWSQRQKLRVLVFLYHHHIPVYLVGRHSDINCWHFRAPTQKEAAEIYGIPQRTICGWVQMQETIESRGSGVLKTQISHAVVNCQWLELESKLYHLFLERREEGQAIRTSWFRTHSFLFFRELYPNASEGTCSTIFQFYKKESPNYHPGVLVEFNKTAYMNDNLFLRYIEQHLIPVLDNKPTLFALDLCSSHKTPAVLDSLRRHNIMPTLIPGGYTSLIQPLDISINKPLKARIRDLTDEAIFENPKKLSIGDRRVLTTWCVGDAWYQFCVKKQDLVKKAFRIIGLSLPIDGSADHELDIKGFSEIDIGDWKTEKYQPDMQYTDVKEENSIEFVADGE